MPRSVKEWIGKTPDSKIPPRVLARIHDRENGICHECGLSLKGKKWQADHRPALINGGENRESKIFPVCIPCHKLRTAKDVAEKAKTAAMKLKDIGAIERGKKWQKAPKDKPSGKAGLPPRQLFRSAE
jgi:5-methylcytosine-specific restriction protein A